VTAHDREDAIEIMRQQLFASSEMPSIVRCIEDVDVSKLDQKHVIPNMGLVVVRGIWFPRGFELI
jgi:hypothetical protein